MFDFSGLWGDFYTQAFILLAIIGVFIMVVGIVTQGVGSAVKAGAAIFIIAIILVCFNNMQAIGEWFQGTFINLGGETGGK